MSSNELETNEMLEMIKVQRETIMQLLNFNRELIQMLRADSQELKTLVDLVARKLNT